ncbi:MAG: hydantoinase/oxoprolinase family protein [Bilophila sp.]
MDTEAARRAVRGWREEGLRAFACVTKFSTRNPSHEDALEAVVREVFADGPEPVIALGHRLSGRLNFPRRIATAYWNAAIWELHNRFADAVEASLRDMGLTAPAYLLKADGGAMPLSVSRERPVEALLSGPAASVMGMLALSPVGEEDVLVLDMGGTTTDMALLAAGQPVLSPQDLVVKGRSTLVRSLKSVSIGLGGDSEVRMTPEGAQVGPLRRGPALAFGGTTGPTFLDCLNVLGHAQAGDTAASQSGVEAMAALYGLSAEALAEQALDCARSRIAAAVRALLDEVNGQPVYTLAALLEGRAVRPARAVLVGGPAEAVAPLLGGVLGMPVETLANPVLGPVANAIGAALTRPTASLESFCGYGGGDHAGAEPRHPSQHFPALYAGGGQGGRLPPPAGACCGGLPRHNLRNRRHRSAGFRHLGRLRARRTGYPCALPVAARRGTVTGKGAGRGLGFVRPFDCAFLLCGGLWSGPVAGPGFRVLRSCGGGSACLPASVIMATFPSFGRRRGAQGKGSLGRRCPVLQQTPFQSERWRARGASFLRHAARSR